MLSKGQLTQLPAQIYNLGSAAGDMLDFSREELWSRMDAPMGAKAVSVPVFLVDEAQMDAIYPPERCRALDPSKVRDWARKKGKKEDEDPLRGLEEDPRAWDRYKEVVTVSVYISYCIGRNFADIIKNKKHCSEDAKNAFLNLEGSAIFICPERVVDWAEEENVPVELVLDDVYYHELGHAVMDSGDTPYDTIWGRTIEESLANWIAYSKFAGSEARLIQRLISTQPPEYQGYAWLRDEIGFALSMYPYLLDRWYLGYGFPLLSTMLPEEQIMQTWIECKAQGWNDEAVKGWKKIAARLLERV